MFRYSDRPSPWLSIPKPNPSARARLFCFPYSGASAAIYYKWADILPASLELCPVQYPGHGTRVSEPLLTQLANVVDGAFQALSPFFDKPFAFFGHSMGALVSFELSCRLNRENSSGPVNLIVSGHGAPHIIDLDRVIYNLPDDQFLEKIRFLNGTPEEVLQNAELRDLILPILRADFTVCDTYTYLPGVLLDCPICACGGLQDRYITRENLDAWRELTRGAFSIRFFPGDHFYLNTASTLLLQVIAREISQIIKL